MVAMESGVSDYIADAVGAPGGQLSAKALSREMALPIQDARRVMPGYLRELKDALTGDKELEGIWWVSGKEAESGDRWMGLVTASRLSFTKSHLASIASEFLFAVKRTDIPAIAPDVMERSAEAMRKEMEGARVLAEPPSQPLVSWYTPKDPSNTNGNTNGSSTNGNGFSAHLPTSNTSNGHSSKVKNEAGEDIKMETGESSSSRASSPPSRASQKPTLPVNKNSGKQSAGSKSQNIASMFSSMASKPKKPVPEKPPQSIKTEELPEPKKLKKEASPKRQKSKTPEKKDQPKRGKRVAIDDSEEEREEEEEQVEEKEEEGKEDEEESPSPTPTREDKGKTRSRRANYIDNSDEESDQQESMALGESRGPPPSAPRIKKTPKKGGLSSGYDDLFSPDEESPVKASASPRRSPRRPPPSSPLPKQTPPKRKPGRPKKTKEVESEELVAKKKKRVREPSPPVEKKRVVARVGAEAAPGLVSHKTSKVTNFTDDDGFIVTREEKETVTEKVKSPMKGKETVTNTTTSQRRSSPRKKEKTDAPKQKTLQSFFSKK